MCGDHPKNHGTATDHGVLPYLRSIQEENPAMGWRALRLGLDRPGLLRTQMRALLKAATWRCCSGRGSAAVRGTSRLAAWLRRSSAMRTHFREHSRYPPNYV